MSTPDPTVFVLLFFFVALIYSSVGLGGGSLYIAILAVAGIGQASIPTTSLTLNVIVASLALATFSRAGHLRLKLVVPLLASSMPMAYLGGRLVLPARIFFWILLASLVGVAVRIYLIGDLHSGLELNAHAKLAASLGLGALLGFAAGAVGIGGGVYLVPALIFLNLAGEREAAAAGSVFVLLNSLAGLLPRLEAGILDPAWLMPLALAVLVGGIFGSHMGAFKFKARTVQRTLGLVVLVAIALLVRREFFLGG